MVLSNEMSSLQLWILFFVTLFEMTIFSCPLLGWSSLLFVLKGEGIYSHLCPGRDENHNISTQTKDPISTRHRDGDKLCVEQEDRLNVGLTLAVLVGAVYFSICGWAIDRFGVKAVKIFSSVMYGISAGIFAVTSADTSMMLIPALVLLTIGQVGLFLSALRSIVLYGKWQSSVNSVFCCAIGSSAVLFLIFKVLYEHGISYQLLCYGFICSSVVLLFNTIIFFPNIKKDDHNSKTIKTKTQKEKLLESPASKCGVERSHRLADLKALVAHMKSGVFIGTCLFIGLCRLRLWFFLGSFQQFMMALPKMDEISVKSYANYYGMVQLCSVAVGPFVCAFITAGAEMCKRSGSNKPQTTTVLSAQEKITKSYNCEVLGTNAADAARAGEVRGCTFYYGCSGIMLTLINILTVIPNAPLQIVTFILITLLRCFYTGAFSNLFLIAFPVNHFGKLYGIGNFVCSMLQLFQYPIFIILENYFPGKILKLNIALLMLSVPIIVGFPYYLWHLGNKMDRKARTLKSSQDVCQTNFHKIVICERLTVV